MNIKLPGEKLLNTLLSWLPTEERNSVAGMFSLLLFTIGAFAVALAPIAFITVAFKLIAPAKDECWDLREVAGQVVKFNKCTGQTQSVDLPKPGSVKSQ